MDWVGTIFQINSLDLRVLTELEAALLLLQTLGYLNGRKNRD